MKRVKKRGQIWVETVIYTLIGLAIIGIVLAVAKPKIDSKKDEIVIDQSIESLRNIDLKISDVITNGQGNRRLIELTIGNGKIFFNLDNSTVSWVLDSSFEYSEQDVPISLGDKFTVTTVKGHPWSVEIEKKYNPNEMGFRFNGESSGIKELDPAAVPYEIFVENSGKDNTGKSMVDIQSS